MPAKTQKAPTEAQIAELITTTEALLQNRAALSNGAATRATKVIQAGALVFTSPRDTVALPHNACELLILISALKHALAEAQATAAPAADAPAAAVRVVALRSKKNEGWTRKGIQRPSCMGNPFPVKEDGQQLRTAAEATALFRPWLAQQLADPTSKQSAWITEVRQLLADGKQVELGCCGDPNCHGHAIADALSDHLARVSGSAHSTKTQSSTEVSDLDAPADLDAEPVAAAPATSAELPHATDLGAADAPAAAKADPLAALIAKARAAGSKLDDRAIAQLAGLPGTLRLTPTGNNGNTKAPFGDGWDKPGAASYTGAEVAVMTAHPVIGAGILTGPQGLGVLGIDWDVQEENPDATGDKFLEITGHTEADLPPTARLESGKPGRWKALFQVPEHRWAELGNWSHSIKAQLPGGGREIVLEFLWLTGAGKCRHLAMAGPHLHRTEENDWHFRWVPGHHPAETPVAEAPDWLLDAFVAESKRRVQSTNEAMGSGYDSAGSSGSSADAGPRPWESLSNGLRFALLTEHLLKHAPPRLEAGSGTYDDGLHLLAGLLHEFHDPEIVVHLLRKSGYLDLCDDDWADEAALIKKLVSLKTHPPKGQPRTIATVIHLCTKVGNSTNGKAKWPEEFLPPVTLTQAELTEKTAEEAAVIKRVVGMLVELHRQSGDNWNKIASLMSRLQNLARLRPEAIQSRVMNRLGEEWGLVTVLSDAGDDLEAGCFSGGMTNEDAPTSRNEVFPGLLYQNTIHLAWGEPGTGKTLHAMQMLYCWIKGIHYLDAPVAQPLPAGKKLLVILTDPGVESARMMWDRYVEELGFKGDPDWDARVEVRRPDPSTGAPPWTVCPKDLDWLNRKLETGNYAGVVIDALSSVVDDSPMTGLNVYDPEFSKVYEVINQLVVRHCFIWWLHHSKKDARGTSGFSGIPAISRRPSVVHRLEKAERRDTGSDAVTRRFYWHADKTRAGLERSFEVLKDQDNRFFVKHQDYQLDFRNAVLVMLGNELDGAGLSPSEILARLEQDRWKIVGNRAHDEEQRDIVRDHLQSLMGNNPEARVAIDVPVVKRTKVYKEVGALEAQGLVRELTPAAKPKAPPAASIGERLAADHARKPGKQSKRYALTAAGERVRRELMAQLR